MHLFFRVSIYPNTEALSPNSIYTFYGFGDLTIMFGYLDPLVLLLLEACVVAKDLKAASDFLMKHGAQSGDGCAYLESQ